jgi:hypothetical protein
MRFYGKLKPGGTAAGTLEYFGEVETASGTQYCKTGVVDWTASTGPRLGERGSSRSRPEIINGTVRNGSGLNGGTA